MKELGGLKVGNLFHLKARARQASLSKKRGFAALGARRSLQGGVRVPWVRLGSATGKEPPIFQSPRSGVGAAHLRWLSEEWCGRGGAWERRHTTQSASWASLCWRLCGHV